MARTKGLPTLRSGVIPNFEINSIKHRYFSSSLLRASPVLYWSMKSCKHVIQPKHHIMFRKLHLFFTANTKSDFPRSQSFHKRQSNFLDPVCNARPGQGLTFLPACILDGDKVDETKQNKYAFHSPGISTRTQLNQNLTLPNNWKQPLLQG